MNVCEARAAGTYLDFPAVPVDVDLVAPQISMGKGWLHGMQVVDSLQDLPRHSL